MDGYGDHYTKCSKSDKDEYITYTWNLTKMIQNIFVIGFLNHKAVRR